MANFCGHFPKPRLVSRVALGARPWRIDFVTETPSALQARIHFHQCVCFSRSFTAFGSVVNAMSLVAGASLRVPRCGCLVVGASLWVAKCLDRCKLSPQRLKHRRLSGAKPPIDCGPANAVSLVPHVQFEVIADSAKP